MDNFYFLIKRTQLGKIVIYTINYRSKSLKKCLYYNYPICFTSYQIHNLVLLISFHYLIDVISVKHALYLGKELSKLEISIFTKQIYIQD